MKCGVWLGEGSAQSWCLPQEEKEDCCERRNWVSKSAGVRGRQCSVQVNLVSLGIEEAAFANWSVTIFPGPISGRVSHLQLPVSGGAVLGTEQASVLVTPPRACPAHSASGQPPMGLATALCAALFNSSVFIFMTFKVVHSSSLSILLFFSLPDNSRLCSDASNQCRRQLCASHSGPSIASTRL